MLIPAGFAHGFQTLSDDVELCIATLMPIHPLAEGGLNPTDSQVAVAWPLPVARWSERDQHLPTVPKDL